MNPATALVVDDTPANRDFLVRLLQQAKLNVNGAANGAEAQRFIDEHDTLDIALVDMQLPDISGLRLTQLIREKYPEACIVVATMYDDRGWQEKAFANGCDVFLVKPHGFMELFRRLTTVGIVAFKSQAPLVIDQYGPRPFRTAAVKA